MTEYQALNHAQAQIFLMWLALSASYGKHPAWRLVQLVLIVVACVMGIFRFVLLEL